MITRVAPSCGSIYSMLYSSSTLLLFIQHLLTVTAGRLPHGKYHCQVSLTKAWREAATSTTGARQLVVFPLMLFSPHLRNRCHPQIVKSTQHRYLQILCPRYLRSVRDNPYIPDHHPRRIGDDMNACTRNNIVIISSVLAAKQDRHILEVTS